MEKEINVLGNALEDPDRPFTAIIGGSKVKDKIGVIDNLLEKVDHLLIGGGLSFTFIKAMGHEIGDSLLEEDKIDLAKQFIEKAKEKGVSLHLPKDVVMANKFAEDADKKIVSVEEMTAGWQGLDIGPETVKEYADTIKNSQLILWNGPMGVFEMVHLLMERKVLQKHWQQQTVIPLSVVQTQLQPLRSSTMPKR